MRRSLHPVVEGVVVVGAVAVVLAVSEVVLLVVGGEVGECEAVVRGHEVHRGEWAALLREDAPRAGKLRGELADPDRCNAVRASRCDVGEPEVAGAVTIVVVPLRPRFGEVADLPAAHSHVPGFGDHLDALQLRVGGYRFDQRMTRVEFNPLVTPEGRGEVESEAVDLHLVRPVPQ